MRTNGAIDEFGNRSAGDRSRTGHRAGDLARARAAIADSGIAPWADLDRPSAAGGDASVDAWSLASRGGLHEWFGSGTAGRGAEARGVGHDRLWLPPMAMLIGLAWEAIEADERKRVVWIGRRCWPYPPALVRRIPPLPGSRGTAMDGDRRLLERSVFVETGASKAGRGERVWAIELSARCAGVGAVIADGSGLTMAESRRLQLAAAGTALLLARPPWEAHELSAARTRWRVSPMPLADVMDRENRGCPGWALELLRCKGLRTGRATEDARRWAVRRDHATGHLTMEYGPGSSGDGGVASSVVDGSGPPASARFA